MSSAGEHSRPGRRARMALPRCLRALGLAALVTQAAGQARADSDYDYYGHSFGSLTLADGQSRKIRTGVIYMLMRVCNDFESSATVSITIDDQPTTELGPGRCTEDRGNIIVMVNRGGGSAAITYRAIAEQFPP